MLIAQAPSGRNVEHNARAAAILGQGVTPAAPGEGPARWVGFHPEGSSAAADEWPLLRVARDGERSAELKDG